MLLQHPTVAVWIGRYFGDDLMKRVGAAYANQRPTEPGRRHRWRQVVALRASGKVQMCNFVRRLRREKRAGLRLHYLVLLFYDVANSRDLQTLLENQAEFNLSFVVYGTLCMQGVPGELLPRCTYVLESPDGALYDGAPVVHARQVRNGDQVGVLDVPTDTQLQRKQQQAESDMSRLPPHMRDVYRAHEMWKQRRAFGAVPTWSQQHRTQAPPKEAPRVSQRVRKATDLTLTEACNLLGIQESDAGNEAVLKRAYRRLALVYHPDKRSGNNELFARINVAYDLLCSLRETCATTK